jgi:hypothetical protein
MLLTPALLRGQNAFEVPCIPLGKGRRACIGGQWFRWFTLAIEG